MTQTKGFTIFARAWTATSPYKTYNPSMRMSSPSPPLSDDGQSMDSSPSENGVETPSAVSSTTTSSAASETSSMVSSTTTVSSTCSETSGVLPSSTTVSSSHPHTSNATSRPKVDFSRLQSIFTAETATDGSAPSPSSLWYILTTALLLAFHKEKLIGELWTYLSRAAPTGDDDRLLATARHIREASLKASTLVGFPRAINALLTLHRAISSSHPSLSTILEGDTSLRSSPFLSPADKFNRGMALFQTIYDKHTARVMSTMSSCSGGGDLTHFAIHCIYGELLAENAIIGDLETGLLEFVCCLADGVAPQAKGHFFGSVNLGATTGQLRATVLMAEELARQVRVPCPWVGGDEDEDEEEEGFRTETEKTDEWKFLRKVM